MTLDTDPSPEQRGEILRVIEADTAAYLKKDRDRWEQCFVHDRRMTSIISTADMGLLRSNGFDQFRETIFQAMSATPDASDAKVGRQHMQITICGDMAWASFDQTIEKSADPMDPPSRTHEFRLLERHDGQWRIAFHAVFEPRLAAETVPLLEIDENRQVLRMNETAREKLKQFKILTISAGRLRASRPAWDKTLQAAIANASALLNYPDYNRMVRESGRKATFPVVLGESEGRLAVCLVLVTDFKLFVSFDDPGALTQRLSVAGVIYGLTDAQLRLAGHIAEGRDLPAGAEAMGISVNTAKTHLKRMFDKTGVHTQPALIRLLLSVG